MKFTATIFAFALAAGMAAALPGHPNDHHHGHPHDHPHSPPPKQIVTTVTTTTTSTPPAGTNLAGSCSVGKPQCCNSILSEADASKQADFLGLGKVVGAIGLQCQQIPINIIGVAAALDNQCKTTPVCCQGTAQNGLIHTGCSPISIN
ncbi:unnamed protein product [Parajaminaea phylloscopi]